MKPFLLVLSSPSGGGKTTIARSLLQARDDLGYSVSATTRPMRDGERDGVDYHFIARPEFLRRVEAGEFLEWATYAGNLYGTLRSEIDGIFARGRTAVLDVEIEGARQIRASFPNSLHLFVLPPSAEVLVSRLAGRKTEASVVVRERITRAADELAAARPTGKQLGFLAQELGREVNTMGSKANDAEIAQQVIAMKGELEKFREQLENLE